MKSFHKINIKGKKTHHLPTPSILNLNRGMANRTLSTPLNLIACTLSNEEGLRASLVRVVIDTLLDGEVEDLAFRDGLAGYLLRQSS